MNIHIIRFKSDLSYSIVIHHEHSQSEHHNDSDSDENEPDCDGNDHDYPLSHCHSLCSHSAVMIINVHPIIDIADDNTNDYSKYENQPPELVKYSILQSDEINFYLAIIGSSLNLRAPPPFS